MEGGMEDPQSIRYSNEIEDENSDLTTDPAADDSSWAGSKVEAAEMAAAVNDPTEKSSAADGEWEVLMEGWLWKKGGGTRKMFGRRNWKKRWVKLLRRKEAEDKAEDNAGGADVVSGSAGASADGAVQLQCFTAEAGTAKFLKKIVNLDQYDSVEMFETAAKHKKQRTKDGDTKDGGDTGDANPMNGEDSPSKGGKEATDGGGRFHLRLVAAKCTADTLGTDDPTSSSDANGGGEGSEPTVRKAPEVEREFNMSAER